MKVIIYPEIPDILLEEKKPSHSRLLEELMEKMEEGEVARIKKKDWKAKTAPAHMISSMISPRYGKLSGSEYTFSGREDDNYWYLMKVKYPIDIEQPDGGYKRRNDWGKDIDYTFEIIKKEEK